MKIFYRFLLLFALILYSNSFSQTTGKLTGKVTDSDLNGPMIGANILIEGTAIGAATDANGEFVILNIPPGTYNVVAKMIGYQTVKIENVVVNVNRSTYLDFTMKQSTIEMDEVVVSSTKIASKKDQTASIKNVSSDEIEMLPVESIGEVVSMQAGIVRGHFRGGRSGESLTMIDGIQVDDAFRGNMIGVEKEVVQDLEVITGTFNAEYGNAMSGIVNMVTKDGSDQFHGSAAVNYGNYITSHNDIFPGLSTSDFDRRKDYKAYLSGPVIPGKLHFVINGRYQDNKDHLVYINRYNPIDYNNYESPNPEFWHIEHTGDNKFVPAFNINYNLFGKLTYKPFTSVRTSFTYTQGNSEGMGYSHEWKYNPQGVSRYNDFSRSYTLQWNHTISRNMFYLAQVSYLTSDYLGSLYEDPLDSRYLHGGYARLEGTGFYTGGQQKGYSKTDTKKLIGKLSLSWQINNNHLIKAGADFQAHDVSVLYSSIRNKYENNQDLFGAFSVDPETGKVTFLYFDPELYADSVLGIESYSHAPKDFAAYVQDKMEFDEMVVNVGLRYDYYDPNTVYPSNPRNPGNQLQFDDPAKMSTYLTAGAQSQLSPRIGLSYQLGDAALLRFAYGHFFQRPPFSVFYQNSSFQVSPKDYGAVMGNPNLKPEKTVQYEVGLWTQMFTGMNVEVAVFYKDIYNLLTIIPIATYNQVRYGLYGNKDYGNAKGLEVTWNYKFGNISAAMNYTLQYTKGVADDPSTNFSRAGSKLNPISYMIPLSWDQRHTLNLNIGYSSEDFGVSTTLFYNSGYPYTWSPLPESRLSDVRLYPNNAPRPSLFSMDLSAYYDIFKSKDYSVRLDLLVYNLLDNLGEVSVYSNTGRAYTTIIRESDRADHHSDFNTYEDRVQNPAMYSAPRLVKLGLQFIF